MDLFPDEGPAPNNLADETVVDSSSDRLVVAKRQGAWNETWFELERVGRMRGRMLSLRCASVTAFGTKTEYPLGEDALETRSMQPTDKDRTDVQIEIAYRSRLPFWSNRGFRTDFERELDGIASLAKDGGPTPVPPASSWRGPLRRLAVFAISAALMAWLFGPVVGLVLTMMLLVHEVGHALAFRMVGERVMAIGFIPFLGAYTTGSPPRTATRDARVSLGGAMFSWPIIMICAVLPSFMYVLGRWDLPWWLLTRDGIEGLNASAICYIVAFVGAALNLLQLVPAPFLDGGRVVGAFRP